MLAAHYRSELLRRGAVYLFLKKRSSLEELIGFPLLLLDHQEQDHLSLETMQRKASQGFSGSPNQTQVHQVSRDLESQMAIRPPVIHPHSSILLPSMQHLLMLLSSGNMSAVGRKR